MATARSTAPRTTAEHTLEQEVREGRTPYVRFRDGARFHVVALPPTEVPLYIGRNRDSAIHIAADEWVSRSHARLLFGAGSWSIEDRGSRNGTRVDGKLISNEQPLADGASIELSPDTTISFHDPYGYAARPTRPADTLFGPPLEPTETQRLILVELARPAFEGAANEHPIPPTNAAIAERVGFTTATVRDNVSKLYGRAKLPSGGDQRQALVELAMRQRVVTSDDYRR